MRTNWQAAQTIEDHASGQLLCERHLRPCSKRAVIKGAVEGTAWSVVYHISGSPERAGRLRRSSFISYR